MAKPLWGLKFVIVNRLDGRREHLVYDGCLPALFTTRAAARTYADARFGYIRTRLDLQAEPHGWRVPQPVRVGVQIL